MTRSELLLIVTAAICGACEGSGTEETETSSQALTLNLSVASYGVTPGNPDNWAAMQNMATAICQINQSYSIILTFPPGVYNIAHIVPASDEHRPDALGLPTPRAIVFYGCNKPLQINGYGAIVSVNGNFTKTATSNYAGTNEWDVDQYAVTPFTFVSSSHFSIAGIEINGNANLMTQSPFAPSAYMVEGAEYGIETLSCTDYSFVDVNVHHMATDGIVLGRTEPADARVDLTRVTLANNTRNNLTLDLIHDVSVTNSVLANAGNNGSVPPASGGFPTHSPAAGVDIEADCAPANATTWGLQWTLCASTNLNGNFLFDGVTMTTNLGGGVRAPHGDTTANITIRNSTFNGAPSTSFGATPCATLQGLGCSGGSAPSVELGVPGGQLINSYLNLGYDTIMPCYTAATSGEMGSATLAQDLNVLATDPWVAAHGIYAETRPLVTTRVAGNTITGARSLLSCQSAIPELIVGGNSFSGQQVASMSGDFWWEHLQYLQIFFEAAYNHFPNIAPFANVESNTFFIPGAAPPLAKCNGGLINFDAVNTASNNTYNTDSTVPAETFWAMYQSMKTLGYHANGEQFLSRGVAPVNYPPCASFALPDFNGTILTF